MQELAKEEGEESKTKLRAATVTSEGAIPAVAIKRGGHVEGDFLEVLTSYGGLGSLQGSLSGWKPIQMLPPPSPHHHLRQAHWLRGC